MNLEWHRDVVYMDHLNKWKYHDIPYLWTKNTKILRNDHVFNILKNCIAPVKGVTNIEPM